MAVAAVVTAAAVVGAVVLATPDGKSASSNAPTERANTATVERGGLSTMVTLNGVLAYRAGVDGSPYVAINQAIGTYTKLPERGVRIACGDELYRVDDRPVLLLCGPMPSYRDLHLGDAGDDVRQLNANLHAIGDDSAAGVGIDPDDHVFSDTTERAVERLQQRIGMAPTGTLARHDAIFLPTAVLITNVTGELGAAAQPGSAVAQATSDTLEVQVALEVSRQGLMQRGDPAQIVLPDNASATGVVDRIGPVTQGPAGPNGDAGPVTIPVFITLDDPGQAHDLNQAPVQVDVTTQGVDDVLSVPVTAIVGKAGGGFAVEVVRGSGRRGLIAVQLGLVDTTAGRVQVEGDLHAGDHVVVPSS